MLLKFLTAFADVFELLAKYPCNKVNFAPPPGFAPLRALLTPLGALPQSLVSVMF